MSIDVSITPLEQIYKDYVYLNVAIKPRCEVYPNRYSDTKVHYHENVYREVSYPN